MKSKTMLALAAVTLTAGAAWAPLAAAKPPVANFAVTEAEVLAAQKAWGDALVQISKDYEAGGRDKATATATAVLDAAYGYKHGPVLFKPTLTVAPQTFRHTKEGALAYFVGGNKAFPKDDGFALKGWRSVQVANDAIILEGDVAMTQGNVMLTNAKGEKTTVDKTWVYRKDDEGKLRIVVHHSSLPFAPK
jgi:hypothetical protein